jgi:hypothetical protein
MNQITASIELSFEHTTPDGNFGESLINIEFCYYPGDPGRYYGEPGDCYPSEPADWEFQRASIRDGDKWKPIREGDWLHDWSVAALAAADPDRIADCLPSGPDPDDLRDDAFDRKLNR